jgi:hypothetical protein
MPLGQQVDPAMRPQPKGGQEARGKVIAGLALEMARMAIPLFPKESTMAIMLAEIAAKMGKEFAKPPEDLGQAELKFMGQQLYPGQKPAAMDMGGNVRSSLMGQGVPAPAPGMGAAPPAMAGAAPQG